MSTTERGRIEAANTALFAYTSYSKLCTCKWWCDVCVWEWNSVSVSARVSVSEWVSECVCVCVHKLRMSWCIKMSKNYLLCSVVVSHLLKSSRYLLIVVPRQHRRANSLYKLHFLLFPVMQLVGWMSTMAHLAIFWHLQGFESLV